MIIEDYGTEMPDKVDTSIPSTPIKYVEVNAEGIALKAEIFIYYKDSELRGFEIL